MAHGPDPDTWEQGPAYERYVGRWSRQVAPRFLEWLRMPPGLRWLDVGCGTGALSAAILDTCAPAAVDGVEPSEGFLEVAVAELGNRVTFHRADATALPLDDASVDVVVSGLVLNFVPDLDAALAEMSRVTVAGGVVARLRLGLRRAAWSSCAGSGRPPSSSTRRPPRSTRAPVRRSHARGPRGCSRAPGWSTSRRRRSRCRRGSRDFDDYWAPFLGGQGLAPAYAMSLEAPARDRLRERLRELVPTAPDGSIDLVARAWTVRGVVSH